jgi:hypothetical protein
MSKKLYAGASFFVGFLVAGLIMAGAASGGAKSPAGRAAKPNCCVGGAEPTCCQLGLECCVGAVTP